MTGKIRRAPPEIATIAVMTLAIIAIIAGMTTTAMPIATATETTRAATLERFVIKQTVL